MINDLLKIYLTNLIFALVRLQQQQQHFSNINICIYNNNKKKKYFEIFMNNENLKF